MTIDTDALNNSPEESAYLPLAEAVLQQYTLGPVRITFVQHNAGIVFHVVEQATGQQYALKIYKRVGAGADPSAEQLEPGLHWLAALAQATDVVVQVPLATNGKRFVGQVALAPATQPVSCTLQRWIDGRLPNGDFTQQQAYELGRMTAKLHAFSSSYPLDTRLPAMRHDAQALRSNISLLRTALPSTLLSSDDVEILLAAQQRITDVMYELGNDSSVWGPVHGDIHYDNLLIYNEEIRPIDFTGLRLAHYLYDIGVTMYHTFHQGSALRQSYFAGYQQISQLPTAYQQYVEAFLVYATVDNVAWNCTIPEQLTGSLFQQNIHNLIHNYALPFVQGRRFLFS